MSLESYLPRFIRRRILFERRMIRWPGVFELSLGNWALALELINTGDDHDYRMSWVIRVSVLPASLYLNIPLPRRKIALSKAGWPRYGEQDSWGVAFLFSDMRSMHAHWGRHYRIWGYPFVNWEHLRTEVRRPDGTWVEAVSSWEERGEGRGEPGADVNYLGKPYKDPDGREYKTFPYRYTRKSGEVQNVTAKVNARRDIRRRKWLTWTKLSEWTDNSIDVNFDGEVGERAGSWKGGCLGCGYSMLPGETMESALKRMESERKFR